MVGRGGAADIAGWREPSSVIPDVWAEQVAGGVAVLASHAHRSAGAQPTQVLMPVEGVVPPVPRACRRPGQSRGVLCIPTARTNCQEPPVGAK